MSTMLHSLEFEFGLRILEGIYIKKEKPLLNNQDTCVPLYVTL